MTVSNNCHEKRQKIIEDSEKITLFREFESDIFHRHFVDLKLQEVENLLRLTTRRIFQNEGSFSNLSIKLRAYLKMTNVDSDSPRNKLVSR